MVDLTTVQLDSNIPINGKITIYHSTTTIVSGRPKESFESFVVDCWLEKSKEALVKKYSTESDIQAFAMIPIRELKYLSDYIFTQQSDTDGYFTVAGGKDRVVVGEVVREITKASDLTDDDTIETLLATDVEELIIPRGLHHIEVGLK